MDDLLARHQGMATRSDEGLFATSRAILLQYSKYCNNVCQALTIDD